MGTNLETTSMVPFAAIVSGRQRIAWQELPVRGLIIGLAVAVALRLVTIGSSHTAGCS
jgi:uncharacterized membrane protein